MAYVNDNTLAAQFSGMLGKEIVFRQWEGKTVVAKAPKSRTGDPPAAQALTQQRFQLASRYAKAVVTDQDPGMAEAYAAVLRPRQNIYSRALEDFMSPPVVESINAKNYRGMAGDHITVRAKDDFRVLAVWIEIYAADGTMLEAGNAEQKINGIDWMYTAMKVNDLREGSRIRAVATDVPGNEKAGEIVL